MQQDNDPKYIANTIKMFISGKKVQGFRLAKQIFLLKFNWNCILLTDEENKVKNKYKHLPFYSTFALLQFVNLL